MKNLSHSPTHALLEKALFFCKTNQPEKAKTIYRQFIKNFPNNTTALTNLGTIELQMGNFNSGISYLEKSILLDGGQPNAINNLANGLYEINRFDDALIKIKTIEHLDYIDAHYNKGRILKALNRFDEAIEAYDYVLKLNPSHILALINRGLIFHEKKQFIEALENYELVIELNPNYAEAYYNQGLSNTELKKYEDAMKNYQDAIQINPNYEAAYCNLGILYNSLSEPNKAIQSIEKAIQINPNYAEAYYNCGVIYEGHKNYNYALKAYKTAIQINPNYAEAFVNLGLIQLNLKNFKEGWINFEKRFLLDGYKIKDISLKSKEININSIKVSKKTLLIGEQGIGDQLLFSSMLPDLLSNIKRLDIIIDERLIPLFQRSFPQVSFISNKIQIDNSQYEAIISICSLGKLFRNYEEDFKTHATHYLRNDPNKLYCPRKNSKKLCGISWKSKNEKIGENKSITLEKLLPILSLPNLEFVCLQYGDVENDIKEIESKYNIQIRKIEGIDIFKNIDGLASIVSEMDFIVTTSNINAHIAGSFGKEVYLLVPNSIGKIWYWHESDKQSLWYPSTKIYRQSNNKSWEDPINEIVNDLREKLIG